jgi:uncharacterized protein
MISTANNNALIVFVKNPIIGKVKTRIAREIGNENALAIYIKMLNHLNKWLIHTPFEKWVFFSDFIDYNSIWEADYFHYSVQHGNDLGEKMLHAMNEILAIHSKVILIGSDIANLNETILQQGFDALEKNDLVLGPASDGGYYLIGTKQPIPELFSQMPWGTMDVLALSRQRADELGLKVALLPVLNDIDYLEDWLSWGHAFDDGS